jgi:uncharacterized protein YaiI (UPF0178 family)
MVIPKPVQEASASLATASIWVDADACPKVIKEILFRAAERTGVSVTLVANQPIAKGGEALNPRGELYSPDTIRGVLTMRDFMDTMRASGHVGGGPPALTQADRNAFAGHLDKWLARPRKK